MPGYCFAIFFSLFAYCLAGRLLLRGIPSKAVHFVLFFTSCSNLWWYVCCCRLCYLIFTLTICLDFFLLQIYSQLHTACCHKCQFCFGKLLYQIIVPNAQLAFPLSKVKLITVVCLFANRECQEVSLWNKTMTDGMPSWVIPGQKHHYMTAIKKPPFRHDRIDRTKCSEAS